MRMIFKDYPKCGNASYCRYSKDRKHCHASELVIKECPYLNNLDEYIKIVLELNEKEMKELEDTV